ASHHRRSGPQPTLLRRHVPRPRAGPSEYRAGQSQGHRNVLRLEREGNPRDVCGGTGSEQSGALRLPQNQGECRAAPMTFTLLRASRPSNRTSRGVVALIGRSIDDVKAKQINAPLCAGAAWPPGLGHNLHRVEASMHLTRASSYAISALVYMAKQKGNPPVASHTVAKAPPRPQP